MLGQPLDFTGYSSIQFFNSPPFPEQSQLGDTWNIFEITPSKSDIFDNVETLTSYL